MELSFLQIVIPLISAGATCIIGYLFNKLKKHEEEREKKEKEILSEAEATNKALKAGILALCRDRILQGYHYYRHNDEISTQDLETMTKLYNAYHALGGNGTITAIWEKIQELPLKEVE